jgi:hypothetical protein
VELDVRNLSLRRLGLESTGYLNRREYHQSYKKNNYDVMDQQLRRKGWTQPIKNRKKCISFSRLGGDSARYLKRMAYHQLMSGA